MTKTNKCFPMWSWHFQSWKPRVLFIGGATLGFYLDEALHNLLRVTLDKPRVLEFVAWTFAKFIAFARAAIQVKTCKLPCPDRRRFFIDLSFFQAS